MLPRTCQSTLDWCSSRCRLITDRATSSVLQTVRGHPPISPVASSRLSHAWHRLWASVRLTMRTTAFAHISTHVPSFQRLRASKRLRAILVCRGPPALRVCGVYQRLPLNQKRRSCNDELSRTPSSFLLLLALSKILHWQQTVDLFHHWHVNFRNTRSCLCVTTGMSDETELIPLQLNCSRNMLSLGTIKFRNERCL